MILEILGACFVWNTIDLVESMGETLEDIADSLDIYEDDEEIYS